MSLVCFVRFLVSLPPTRLRVTRTADKRHVQNTRRTDSKRSAPLTPRRHRATPTRETEPRHSGARLIPLQARCLLTCETDTSRPTHKANRLYNACPSDTKPITMPICCIAPNTNPPRAKWAHDDHRRNLLRGGTTPHNGGKTSLGR